MRISIRVVLLAGAACLGGVALAQDYPAKSIRIIVPYSAGGGTDVMARVIAKQLTASWGQPAVVENRTGAAGIIGTQAMAKATPDGYTLGVTSSAHATVPNMYSNLPFDFIRDFTFISLIATAPNVMVTHPSLPVTSVTELIALAKRRPGELTFASGGLGVHLHLQAEHFNHMVGIKALHVPYRGSPPAEIDLAGGYVSYMIDSMVSAFPNIKGGRTRTLATTGKKRSAALPNVPTLLESGLPLEMYTWWGMVGPAGIPQSVVNKLAAEIGRIVQLADVKDFLLTQGAEPTASTPQQFSDWVKKETALYAKIIENAKIPRIDQ